MKHDTFATRWYCIERVVLSSKLNRHFIGGDDWRKYWSTASRVFIRNINKFAYGVCAVACNKRWVAAQDADKTACDERCAVYTTNELLLDDNAETIYTIKMRPRTSWDGGETANAFRK